MKFDSKLEQRVYAVLKNCKYHPSDRIQYKIPKVYEPDFVYYGRHKTIWIEVKGRFRTSEEARKYVYAAKALGSKEELVFIFQKPNTPMPGARRRRNGTKYTMQEWADKHGFRWFTVETVPREWK